MTPSTGTRGADEVARIARPFLDALWADRQPVVRDVARTVIAAVPSYTTTPSSEVWVGMERILERIVAGDPLAEPTEDDRIAALGTGIQGAGAGITTEDLVAAVLLGSRVVVEHLLAAMTDAGVAADVRLEVSVRSRRWVDQVAVWAAAGLRQSGRATDADRDADLLEAVLGGAPSDRIVRAAAERGIDPGQARYAVVAERIGPPPPGGAVEISSLLLEASGERPVWRVEGARLFGATVAAPRPRGELAVAVAGPVPWRELGAAFAEASRAAATAVALGGPGVHTLGGLGLLVPLHEEPGLRTRLEDRWLARLDARQRQTVRAWVEHRGSVDAVATALGVHANTVRNRCARITEAIGEDWRTPRAQAEIWAALVASPASG